MNRICSEHQLKLDKIRGGGGALLPLDKRLIKQLTDAGDLECTHLRQRDTAENTPINRCFLSLCCEVTPFSADGRASGQDDCSNNSKTPHRRQLLPSRVESGPAAIMTFDLWWRERCQEPKWTVLMSGLLFPGSRCNFDMMDFSLIRRFLN